MRIDTARVYRGEKLPRALPWETVRAFLRSIDRSTSMGRRDYAMFMLIVTYGLRACEVVSLKLDDIGWRSMQLRVSRPKVRSALVLPLTDEVAAAMLAYLQAGRICHTGRSSSGNEPQLGHSSRLPLLKHFRVA
jgi:integrase